MTDSQTDKIMYRVDAGGGKGSLLEGTLKFWKSLSRCTYILGIVPFMTMPLKGRFLVFSQ